MKKNEQKTEEDSYKRRVRVTPLSQVLVALDCVYASCPEGAESLDELQKVHGRDRFWEIRKAVSYFCADDDTPCITRAGD